MTSLLFIYNANSGLSNTLFDIGHKILSPSTYPCKLCDITYGIFTENEVWKDYRLNSNNDLKFYHIDEFVSTFPNERFEYPIILIKEDGTLKPFLNAESIDKMSTANDLIACIEKKLQDPLNQLEYLT